MFSCNTTYVVLTFFIETWIHKYCAFLKSTSRFTLTYMLCRLAIGMSDRRQQHSSFNAHPPEELLFSLLRADLDHLNTFQPCTPLDQMPLWFRWECYVCSLFATRLVATCVLLSPHDILRQLISRFCLQATDGQDTSNLISVPVSIAQVPIAPLANDQTVSITTNGQISSIALDTTDPNGEALTIFIVQEPAVRYLCRHAWNAGPLSFRIFAQYCLCHYTAPRSHD